MVRDMIEGDLPAVWLDVNQNAHEISLMETPHLRNTIAMLQRRLGLRLMIFEMAYAQYGEVATRRMPWPEEDLIHVYVEVKRCKMICAMRRELQARGESL